MALIITQDAKKTFLKKAFTRDFTRQVVANTGIRTHESYTSLKMSFDERFSRAKTARIFRSPFETKFNLAMLFLG